jgi:hypothetical protein
MKSQDVSLFTVIEIQNWLILTKRIIPITEIIRFYQENSKNSS